MRNSLAEERKEGAEGLLLCHFVRGFAYILFPLSSLYQLRVFSQNQNGRDSSPSNHGITFHFSRVAELPEMSEIEVFSE